MTQPQAHQQIQKLSRLSHDPKFLEYLDLLVDLPDDLRQPAWSLVYCEGLGDAIAFCKTQLTEGVMAAVRDAEAIV